MYQCYNNLIRVNSALTIKTKKGEKNIERTPCMAESISDHIWTWKDLLMFKMPSTIDYATARKLANEIMNDPDFERVNGITVWKP